MKAVQKWGDGKDGMGLRDVPEPKMKSDEVLMEVACVGICGSDLHIWKDEKEHKRPVTLGHEFSGVIIAKGKNVGSQWQVGDRIVASNESMAGRIGTTVDGAYAERMTVPERCVHRMPDSMSFEEGALVELVTAMSYSAMYRTPLKPADFVVLCGPGPVGLVMLQIVRLFSPRAIMVTGTKSDDLRLQKAKALGADYIYCSEDDPVRRVRQLTNGVGADVVIDATGSECGITQATRMARHGGWITVIGLWGHDIKVNLDCVPYNNLTIRGGWGWAGIDSPDQAVRMALGWHSWERGLQIMAMGKIQLKPVITMRIPLEEWREGFERLEAKKEIKIIMYPNKKYLNQ